MLKHLLVILFLPTLIFTSSFAQLPNPAIVGYWENWQGSRFIPLKDIDDRYNVICIAFASPKAGTDYDLEFIPPISYTDQQFKNEMKLLQDEGKIIILSIGGQNDPTMLDTEQEKNAFVSSVNTIVDNWGFDGIDIDLEGNSMKFSGINITNPGDIRQQYLIDAIKEILANHQTSHGKRLLLTMAPETIYFQGALSKWAGAYKGAYLPLIEELSNDIDMINVQLYNTGNMFGIDGAAGGEFSQSTADFIVAMTEAVIRGFKATGSIGTYNGIAASKVGVGLPGCQGWGYTQPAVVEAAINYLMGRGPQPGSYTLKQQGGYPDLRGMMTWSINSDAACSPSYEYVNTWERLFIVTGINDWNEEKRSIIYPNPANGGIINFSQETSAFITITDLNGVEKLNRIEISNTTQIDLSYLMSGSYIVNIEQKDGRVTHQKLMLN